MAKPAAPRKPKTPAAGPGPRTGPRFRSGSEPGSKYGAPVITPAEADALILANLTPLLREHCPLLQAHGRVLRDDIVADRDLPPYDRVTMDGYALRAGALAKGVGKFRIGGMQAAGMRPLALPEADDACVEVMTGAVLPAGADCVVPYENATASDGVVSIIQTAGIAPGAAVHRRGSDHRAGAVVVRAGSRLTGGAIAAAAAVGAATLTVTAVPTIAIVATGDELVEVEHAVAPHQIRRSNDYGLRAALIAAGYARVERFHLRDARSEIERLLRGIIAGHDAVIITGGVSKGKFDFISGELDAQGVRRMFQGVAQRPGKPLWFGVSQRRTPVFALPGNPVSAQTCLYRYVIPALDAASGLSPAPVRRVALARPIGANPALTRFIPAMLASGEHAELIATLAPTNTSGDFAGLVGTDGFVELPPSAVERPAGDVAAFHPWRQ